MFPNRRIAPVNSSRSRVSKKAEKGKLSIKIPLLENQKEEKVSFLTLNFKAYWVRKEMTPEIEQVGKMLKN